MINQCYLEDFLKSEGKKERSWKTYGLVKRIVSRPAIHEREKKRRLRLVRMVWIYSFSKYANPICLRQAI